VLIDNYLAYFLQNVNKSIYHWGGLWVWNFVADLKEKGQEERASTYQAVVRLARESKTYGQK